MKIKFNKNLILLTCFAAASFIIIGAIYAQYTNETGYRIDAGGDMDITVGADSCRKVINSSGKAIFVPTKTDAEWIAFKNNATGITGVTVTDCTPTPAPCGETIVGIDSITYGTVLGADGKCWLDRNLGATQVATSSTDTAAYGWLYQWGRLYDGHQITTSGTTATNSSTDVPGHANFITEDTPPYDWRVPQNDALWQGVSGTNNPCPVGFRLPTQPEWATLITAAGITNSATAYSSSLKLTVAGFRDFSNAALYLQGSSGYYWSSSPIGADAFVIVLASFGVNPGGSNYHAIGYSVRCIKEVAIPPTPTAPSQVTGLTPTPGDTQVTLNWTAPADGGSPITSYKVYRGTISGGESLLLLGGCSGLGIVLTCIDTGLTNGTTYYYKVSAVNAIGEGTQSAEVSAIPAPPPPSFIAGICTGIEIYSQDLSGTYKWKTLNSSCSPPQCGLIGGQDGDNLVNPTTNPTVSFISYPAQNACKAIGGRLPTKADLACIYTNRALLGSFQSNSYWSSTEFSITNAWYQNFASGAVGNIGKTTAYYARCIR